MKLRIARWVLAAVGFAALALLFVDVTGWAASRWGWMAHAQLVPALVGLNLGVIAVLLLLTWLFGRIYCSVICPLGIYQDGVWRLRRWFTPKSKRRRLIAYQPETRRLRWGVAAVAVVLFAAAACGAVSMGIASVLDPYSAFGRIASLLIRPAATAANNLLAAHAEQTGSYAFATLPYLEWSIPVLAVAGITLLTVSIMAWRGGRDYCNKICPVGTLLGCVSRHAVLRPTVDADKCNHCRTCERQCKASCIDGRTGEIDLSRCVACMDCITACPHGAISFSPHHAKSPSKDTVENPSRRAFLIGGAIATGAAIASAGKINDGGMAPVHPKAASLTDMRPVPAGARSLRHLQNSCTACQLCISNCPNGVLRPSASLSRAMQPQMVFTDGWCRTECTVCGDVCPAGAIAQIDEAEKSSTKIGTARVDVERCISASEGTSCGNCQRHCPAGAITMVELPNGHSRPAVNETLCIGCGSCEYHCPVGTAGVISDTRSAIFVEGLEDHRTV